MDDFGRSLERDYGLGRKGRAGARSSSSRNKSLYSFDNSTRFSECFNARSLGAAAAAPPDASASFRSSSSYSVYDEVFSSSALSTIPVFEDVFRVNSSRMKVSELRENDLFRGVVDFRRNGNRSRLTYEDIFAESPDELPNPFNVAGSKPSSSGKQSPAMKENVESSSFKSRSRTATQGRIHGENVEARNGEHHAASKVQGSFLGMSQSFNQEESSKKDGFPAENGVESSATSSPDGVQRAWLSIGEVSLVTKPSENPPPVRSAPGRSSSSRNSGDGATLETAQADSGPPPLRVPPPISSDNAERAAEVPVSSELLERVLRERSMHGEISIREKVLDWQKQNLNQQQAEERESFRRRSETLNKLQADREEVERIAAEVEAAAAEQARMRAERAMAEDLERDARATLLKHQKQEQQQQQDEEQQQEAIVPETRLETARVCDESGEDAGQGGLIELPTLTSEDENKGECGQGLSDAEKSNPGNEEEGGGKAGRGRDEAAALTTQVRTQVVSEATNTDNESSIGIDTISSTSDRESSPPPVAANAGGKGEEPAPETPERLEPLHSRHEKSSKSSEVELLGEDQQEEKLKAGTIQQEEPRREERSLVARLAAEVKGHSGANAERGDRRTRPRLKQDEAVAKHSEDSSSRAGKSRVSLREQLEKERVVRLERSRNGLQDAELAAEAKLRAERSLVERITAEVRERAAANARAEQERVEKEQERLAREAAELKERERLQRLNKAREKERERLERLEKERQRERERLVREMEREREIEREKDRVGLEEKAAKERAEAEAEALRIKMERAAVERATAEARARAERAAYERVVNANGFSDSSRPASVPKQRFTNSTSMPTSGSTMENGIRRTTSSTNLDNERYSTSSNSMEFQQEFQEFKGETPERRKARLERYQRTQNRAAQALALKNKRDLELLSEQAERQRLAERLDADIKRWSVGKDGNIRALLSTLQYVLWPESGWKQVSLTELISPAAVKKAYRRATLCVHPDKMQQKHASVQQKYIAEKVFHILQVGWNKFNAQEAL